MYVTVIVVHKSTTWGSTTMDKKDLKCLNIEKHNNN